MTLEERVRPVMALGFTERQARFLVTVMLHGGVCLRRHYRAATRLAHGVTVRNFFENLVAKRYATAHPYSRNGARLYHVHHRALYAAAGEPNNRNRRATSVSRAIESLMVLDRVLATPEITWLATEHDKLAHFTQTAGVSKDNLPCLVFRSDTSKTIRYFPDKLPIGVHADGRTHEFVYVVNRDVPVDFRAFLYRHATLLRHVPEWVVRLLVPWPFAEAAFAFRRACEEELSVRLSPTTLEELRWYFRERRARSMDAGNSGEDERYQKARRAFGAVRYRVLYRHWLRLGDHLLDALDSPVLPDALARGIGRIESDVVTRGYLHVARVVGTA